MIILKFLLVGAFCILGAGTTIIITAYSIGMIGYKIYRKIKYGYSLYD